jgi:hypothetical protein
MACEGDEVGIGHLFVADDSGFGQILTRNGVRPESMTGKGDDLRQKLLRLLDCRAGSCSQHEANQSALRDWAGGERSAVSLKPGGRAGMRDVIGVSERDQNVRVEKNAHGSDAAVSFIGRLFIQNALNVLGGDWFAGGENRETGFGMADRQRRKGGSVKDEIADDLPQALAALAGNCFG